MKHFFSISILLLFIHISVFANKNPNNNIEYPDSLNVITSKSIDTPPVDTLASTDTINLKIGFVDSLTIYKNRCVAFQDSMKYKESVIQILTDSISSVQSSKNNNEQIMTDSIETLNRKIIDVENKVLEYDRYAMVCDSAILILANYRLKVKFDENLNIATKRYINLIKKDETKESDLYKYITMLTMRYKEDYTQIISILKEAQKDNNRTNIFESDYANTYRIKLKNTMYYKELYKAPWKIPYLNDLLDEVFKILDSENKEKREFVDFTNFIM